MTEPDRVVIGLDVGTSGVKVAAFAPSSSWRHVTERSYPLERPAPGRAEQDPATILAACRDALTECVDGRGSAEVLALSVSTAMHGLVALDADGHPITPLVTWADTRASVEAHQLIDSGLAAQFHRAGGTPIHPMLPLVKLAWFARHEPDTWKSAHLWVGLKGLVLGWLTGTPVTEVSSACGTGLLDLRTRSWNPEALAWCGIDATQLPPIVATTAMLDLDPSTALSFGLRESTKVVAGAGDGPLGNVGTGALAPGVAGLSLGTSGAVRLAVDHPFVDDEGGGFCFALTKDTWIVGGAISNGGLVGRWAGDTFGSADDPDPFADAALVPPGCEGLVMLPFLLPERAPLWQLDVPAAYLGLQSNHGHAHFVRAAVEGVCMQLRVLLDRISATTPIVEVRATGGVFVHPLWRTVLAASIGRPLRIVDGAEGTSLGAAALALYALGQAPTLSEAANRLAGTQVPEPEHVDATATRAATALRASIPELIERLGHFPR